MAFASFSCETVGFRSHDQYTHEHHIRNTFCCPLYVRTLVFLSIHSGSLSLIFLLFRSPLHHYYLWAFICFIIISTTCADIDALIHQFSTLFPTSSAPPPHFPPVFLFVYCVCVCGVLSFIFHLYYMIEFINDCCWS